MSESDADRGCRELGPHLEQRILAFSLAHPGFGPLRISAELARERWGGRISPNGIWRVLRRHGLNTRTRRLSLVAGYAARYERKPPLPEPERHVEAQSRASSSDWTASTSGACRGRRRRLAVHGDRRLLRLRLGRATRLVPQPACRTLLGARAPCRLRACAGGLEAEGADHRQRLRVPCARLHRHPRRALGRAARIRAGRPQTNGHVERLQQTILEECWRPSFARSLVPRLTALEHDLKRYLGYYNFDRAHTGRLTKGRIPGEIVYGARKVRPR